MFGILLASMGSLFTEVSDTIGKTEVKKRKQSLFTMGFLQLFFGVIAFGIIALLDHSSFVFSFASLPTFIPRLILEIIQAHITIVAITRADRSTFSFIRVGTIPLLVAVDVVMGYTVGGVQLAGIGIIIAALLVVFMNHGIKKAGLGWVIASAVNAVITLALYKYNITHYNSVVADQLIICTVLLIYFWVQAYWHFRENPLLFLRHRIFLAQSLSQGVGVVIESFAYNFAPASIITAAKRSSAVLWALVAGQMFFKEKGLVAKFVVFLLLICGIILLIP